MTNFALDFLEKHTQKQPFFLFLFFIEPHQQNDLERFVAPKNSQEKFKNFEVPDDLKALEGDW